MGIRGVTRTGVSAPTTAVMIVAAILAAGLAACGGSSTADPAATSIAPAGEEQGRALLDEGAPTRGGTLTIGMPALTNAGWHPFADNWETAGHVIASAIFETLTTYGPDGDVEMLLAESVEPNDDLTVWTIRVRDGIRFHDGTELDANAVAQNLETALFTGLASIAFTGSIDRVEVTDDLEVEVHLTRPIAVIPEILTGVAGYVAAPAMLDAPDGATHPVGTGPFVLDEWVPDSHFTAVRFDDYWRDGADGRPLPYLDAIRYELIPEPASRKAALDAGDVDMILTTNAADIAAARDDADVISVEDNFSEETFVMLNSLIPPFDEPAAREALAYGTDTESIIEITQEGIVIPATGPFAPGTPWAVEEPGYVTYDPERAEAAVAEYEATTGQPLSFELDGVPISDAQELQELLADGWRRLGIDVTVSTLEQVPYLAGITLGGYQAAWFRSYSHTDPLYLYVFFHSDFAKGAGKLSTNFSQVRDDRLDALLEEGLATADVDRRREIYAEATREINAQLVDIWLFHTPWGLIARPEVSGLNHARAQGFASIEAKSWIGGLWLAE